MTELTPVELSLGCLFGGAMGDAFGYPIEFMPLSNIRFKYGPDGLTEPVLTDGMYRISDDTQMTLLTADGILTGYTRFCYRGIASSPVHYVYPKYRRWAQMQGFPVEVSDDFNSWLLDDSAMIADRAPGNTCIDVLVRCDKPGTMDEPVNDSKGCGGLMRVAPVGLFCARNTDRSVEWAAEIAASTHGHPYGYMTAGFLSSMISHIMNGALLPEAVSCAEKDCLEFFNDPMMKGLCDIIEDAVRLSDSSYSDEECMRSIGEGWVAEETLGMALFSCLRYSDDIKQCLRCAVNVTGDSDSIGSVAGNILGAYLGIGKVSEAFDIDRLEAFDKITVTAEDIVLKCISSEHSPMDKDWKAKYIYCQDPDLKRRELSSFKISL
jgi:ADP-ribosylglycohydrolase